MRLSSMWFLLSVIMLFFGSISDVWSLNGSDGEPGSYDNHEPTHRIAVVLDPGGLGDQAFNDMAYEGMRRVAKEHDGYLANQSNGLVDFGNRVELKYFETDFRRGAREKTLRNVAGVGYDLVLALGFLLTDAVEDAAEDFPDTHFVLVDGFIPDLTSDSNVTIISFAEHEGAFLVGAVAGMYLRDMDIATAKLGFIGGMDIPLVHKYHAGFFAGAMYVNENLREQGTTLGQYIGRRPTAFSDPEGAQLIADTMYERGAEIVFHAAGASGRGVFEAAADRGRLAIGADTPEGLKLSSSLSGEDRRLGEHVLTSMVKQVGQAIFEYSSLFIENGGQVPGGYETYGVKEGAVGYAVHHYNWHWLVPYKEDTEEVVEDIRDGNVGVPDHDDELVEWMESTF